jgi:meso-butanediol dehydrogenase/(S,S)-butanediol dehydrogenase/diacetyl reductase
MTTDQVEVMWDEVSKKYPLRRAGEPQDIAKAIAFLASDDSSFATGVNLKLDGGYLDSLQFIFGK